VHYVCPSLVCLQAINFLLGNVYDICRFIPTRYIRNKITTRYIRKTNTTRETLICGAPVVRHAYQATGIYYQWSTPTCVTVKCHIRGAPRRGAPRIISAAHPIGAPLVCFLFVFFLEYSRNTQYTAQKYIIYSRNAKIYISVTQEFTKIHQYEVKCRKTSI
jgi:hypothetical protein